MFAPLLVLISAATVLAAAPSDAARAAFDRGEKALAAEHLDEAAAAYREAASLSPGYAAAINGLGSALFKQGKRDDAILQFKAAIAADPNFKLAYFNLGYAARKTSDFATAANAYEHYTQLDPEDPDGFYGLAESYRNLRNVPRAIHAYEQYLSKEKRPSEQKWVDKAKEQLAALRAEQPSTASAPASAPTPAAAAGAPSPGPATVPDGAPASPQPAAIPSPSLSSARIAEGDRLMQERRYRDASFAYVDAANADPNSVEAQFKLGNAYAVLGFYAQAIDRWNRVVELTSDPAIKKSAQENVTRAQAKIQQLGGGSPPAQGHLPGTGPIADSTRERARQAYEQGVARINARDFAGALQSLTMAIQLEPTLAVAYIARGSADIGTRRYAEAVLDYQYALKLDPKRASPLYGLAEAYRGLGRPADARTYYQQYVGSTAPDIRADLQAEARKRLEKL